jgi:hypothetical protein
MTACMNWKKELDPLLLTLDLNTRKRTEYMINLGQNY